MSDRASTLRDIVAVIGTTGVGKSQLAIDLALSLRESSASSSNPTTGYNDALILSADSMQLYEGLPLITNKVTQEEMQGVDHWGLNLVKPGEGGSWEVGKWCSEALKTTHSLPPTTLPIICGGTHYYTQHFLFPPSALSINREDEVDDARKTKARSSKWEPPCGLGELLEAGLLAGVELRDGWREYLETFHLPEPRYPPEFETSAGEEDRPVASTSTLPSPLPSPVFIEPNQALLAQHTLLTLVDPAEARRWHWRDGRKTKRGIERWWEGKAAELAGLQGRRDDRVDAGSGGPGLGGEEESGRARFRTVIFWVYDNMDALGPRLDKRVDKMVEGGLLDEIVELRGKAAEINGTEDSIDHEEGIFQSIGYKEFSLIPTSLLHPSHPLFPPALERMKLSTRQYAKKQIKWIRKQLLPAVRRARALGGEVELYVLRGGESGEGVEVLRAFLNGQALPSPDVIGHPDAADLLSLLNADTGDNTAIVPDIAQRQDINARIECPICSQPGSPVTLNKTEWEAHQGSRTHRRAKTKQAKENGEIPMYSGASKKAKRKELIKQAMAGQSEVETGKEGSDGEEGSLSLDALDLHER